MRCGLRGFPLDIGRLLKPSQPNVSAPLLFLHHVTFRVLSSEIITSCTWHFHVLKPAMLFIALSVHVTSLEVRPQRTAVAMHTQTSIFAPPHPKVIISKCDGAYTARSEA
jgi:hypothetical protein